MSTRPLHWRRDSRQRSVHRAWAWGVGEGMEPTANGSFRSLPDYYRIRPIAQRRRIVELVRAGGEVVAVITKGVPTLREAKVIADTDYAARRRNDDKETQS